MIDVVEIAGHEYISAEALSRKFGVHRTTIQRWAKEQGLPFVKVGHTRIFEIAKLAEWLESKAS
jgi:excisionase family DNA binding protein